MNQAVSSPRAQAARLLGATALLAKPLRVAELARAVAAALARRA